MDLLLAATLSCSDGKWILDGIARTSLTSALRSEMIIEILQVMPDDCDEYQYRGEGGRRS